MRLHGWAICFISLIVSGCAAATGPSADWIAQAGGAARNSDQARAELVSRDLFQHCRGRPIVIMVLQNETLAAYSWRDGHIYVTTGLAERLTDAELAAVVAHELGHLVNAGQVQALCGLTGLSSDLDIEARADACGVDLLIACGIPPQRMIDMLRKVQTEGSLPPATQLAIAHRIDLLKARLSTLAIGRS
jgi:Zn-dependent protease with chaperone function